MPIRIFEGARGDQRDEIVRRNMERRFYALAAAVREHEASVRRGRSTAATEDEDLYRRLRQLCGEPTTAQHGAA